uniref:Uncharacterized protein n=1 Tax=Geospiza parvula TaxID=87175 RepID=A0A8U8C6X8_GEOPR
MKSAVPAPPEPHSELDLERFKLELLEEFRRELHKMKEEIIQGGGGEFAGILGRGDRGGGRGGGDNDPTPDPPPIFVFFVPLPQRC